MNLKENPQAVSPSNSIDELAVELADYLLSKTNFNYVKIKKVLVKTSELIVEKGNDGLRELYSRKDELEELISENGASLEFIYSFIELAKPGFKSEEKVF